MLAHAGPTSTPHKAGPRLRRIAILHALAAALAVAASMGGCASSGRPRQAAPAESALEPGGRQIRIESSRYEEAFVAAVDYVRALGFEPQVRDRRGGLIEAGPTVSPSILEPWSPTAAFGALENTLHLQRRIVRITFAPAGFNPSPPAADALFGPESDLTWDRGPKVMTVTVVVERQQAPIEHRVSWSFSVRSEAWDYDPASGEKRAAIWQATRRDPAMEVQIGQALARQLADS